MNKFKFEKGNKMNIRIVLTLLMCLSLTFCTSAEKKMQKERQNNPEYQYSLGSFHLNDGNPEQAVRYFNRALVLNPKHALSLDGLGLVYFMQSQFKESLQYFKKCLAISPSMTDARNHLGSVYQEMGLLDQAEREFRAAISDEEYRSRELPYYNLARLYYTQNKNQEALDHLERALLLNERLIMAYNLKGLILETLERYEDAIDSYEQALRFTPDDINLKFNLASAHFKNENYEKAKTIFEDIRMSATTPEMKSDINKYLEIIRNKKLP